MRSRLHRLEGRQPYPSPHDSQDAAIDVAGGDGDGDAGDGDGDGDGDASSSGPCDGHEDGTTFCVGDSVRTCPGALDVPCAGEDQCVDHDGGALCVCAIGANASTDCEPAQECGADHGGCDSVTACVLIGGEPACGACPSGFLGNGFEGCVATVIGIGIENGELLTTIAPETTAFEARVSVFERRARVTFRIPREAALEIDGESVDVSESWTSKVLKSGVNDFDMRLDVPGHAQVRLELVLRREAVQSAYIKADPPAVEDGFGRVVFVDGEQMIVGNLTTTRAASMPARSISSSARAMSGSSKRCWSRATAARSTTSAQRCAGSLTT